MYLLLQYTYYSAGISTSNLQVVGTANCLEYTIFKRQGGV